ncbi:MAG: penicillin acylase family protein [Alphaproteobacteria bacterium]|nr:penicillin acylase family protein [Alphaproteobacteria bacterium]
MKKSFVLCLLIVSLSFGYSHCQNVSRDSIFIYRDVYGIAHVFAETDAQAVFGFLFAQAEDDFERIELNYIEKLGRQAEIFGKDKLAEDLTNRILFDQDSAFMDFKNAPLWLKKLLIAFADGLNYFLKTHPNIKPKLLTHFEPWYPLLWTDGSIGAVGMDNITLKEIKAFYFNNKELDLHEIDDLTRYDKNSKLDEYNASNGFAIAPEKSVSNEAMLYINPHTTLYFRPEIHIVSAEGLNAYGAVTWGQFFIYQGFNEYNGWMHPSTNVDNQDTYYETIVQKNNRYYYEYDHHLFPVGIRNIQLKYLESNEMSEIKVSTYFTNKGPVLAQRNKKWVSLQANNRNIQGLMQSFLRTKTKNIDEFKDILKLCANTSNNTMYADREGNIAYWHGNFFPVRKSHLDCSQTLDGSLKEQNWLGIHRFEDGPAFYNPPSGFLQNCNSNPISAAGVPKNRADFINKYPKYMIPDGENFRSIQALSLLNKIDKINLDQLIQLGYNPYLSAFDIIIPKFIERSGPFFNNYPNFQWLFDSINTWERAINTESMTSTIATTWLENMPSAIKKVYIQSGEKDQVQSTQYFMDTVDPVYLINSLINTYNDLVIKYGADNIKFGKINRFQRLSASSLPYFNDRLNYFSVTHGSSLWGSLASMNTKHFNSKYRYLYSGNSFVCAVQFGKKIVAKSSLAGGVSNNPKAPYFFNQAQDYIQGNFKTVFFYKDDIMKNLSSKQILKYK